MKKLSTFFICFLAVVSACSLFAQVSASKGKNTKSLINVADGYYDALPNWTPLDAAKFPKSPFGVKPEPVVVTDAAKVGAKASASKQVKKDKDTDMNSFLDSFPVTAVALGKPAMIVIAGEVFTEGEVLSFPDSGESSVKKDKSPKLPAGKITFKQVTPDGVLVFEMADDSGENPVEFRHDVPADMKALMY